MELKDTLVTGGAVLAVGTSSFVGGNVVVDKVNDGPTKRQDATVERVMAELAPYIDQRIQQLMFILLVHYQKTLKVKKWQN